MGSNSNYATIKESRGKCYLYLKIIERQHLPKVMWEKIKLSSNFLTALQNISEYLRFWPKFLLKTCKLRLTKIHQFLVRMRKISILNKYQIKNVNKKLEVRLKKRELRKIRTFKLSNIIKNKLLEKLKSGIFS